MSYRKIILFWIGAIVLLGFILCASKVFGFRATRPPMTTFPFTEDQVSQLNRFNEEMWNMQYGRFELDIPTTSKTSAKNGEYWIFNDSGDYKYQYMAGDTVHTLTTSVGSGGGDVYGPNSSVDEAIVRFNGTTGKLIQDYTSGAPAPTCSDLGLCTFTRGITLPQTTGTVTGVVYKGTDNFLHDFSHPTGDTKVPEGNNVFLGENAGNFTMGSTATQTYHSSRNVGIGKDALKVNTTGYSNISIGRLSLDANTEGKGNVAIGDTALSDNIDGGSNVGVGWQALADNTDGTYNTAVGYQAGRYYWTGAASLANSGQTSSVFIGNTTRAGADSGDNEIVIGDGAIGLGSDTAVIGNTSMVTTRISGKIFNPPTIQSCTTTGDMTDPLTSTLVYLAGNDDSSNAVLDLQNGTYDGQMLVLYASTNVDADDTCTIAMTDTTCTNCPAIVFNKVGENATLIWDGNSGGWVVLSLQSSL